MTSDSVRCVQTVQPFADKFGLTLDARAALNEEEAKPGKVRAIVAELVDSGRSAVLCTHRPVLPWVTAAMPGPPGDAQLLEEPLQPGEMILYHHRDGAVVAVERHLVN